MKAVAAVNGLITSEVSAFYAARYASLYNLTLTLLHVANPTDERLDVESSMAVIEEVAAGYKVKTERVFLEGKPEKAICDYLRETRADIVFCSTRMRRRFFEDSLSEKLSRLRPATDLAIVRVARIEAWAMTREAVLPIREERLSVEKFLFFTSMVKALGSSAEIYSISPVSRSRMARLEIGDTKKLFQRINDRLEHYSRALKLLEIPFRIKHALAADEIGQILHHLSHHDCELLVVGGRRLARRPRIFGENRLERLFRLTPVNTIAYYAGSE
ncbi:MAG: universal stress protein [Proteobacteria bacterium]|nr:universal stress protein [Pseudomonadota bacterium]MBU1738272.1 universal stress protein [Pseudomonadota bacterium]